MQNEHFNNIKQVLTRRERKTNFCPLSFMLRVAPKLFEISHREPRSAGQGKGSRLRCIGGAALERQKSQWQWSSHSPTVVFNVKA